MIVVLDTETTGVSKTDQVIQLAAFELPDNITELKSKLVLEGLLLFDL